MQEIEELFAEFQISLTILELNKSRRRIVS